MQGMLDWGGRMKEMMEFVGLNREELELVRVTAPLLLPHAEELISAVYDHLLRFPGTRKFFLTEEGVIDSEHLSLRRHSLIRWLRSTIDFKVDQEFPVSLWAAGMVHRHPSSYRAHLGAIPSRYMIGTISFVQTELTQLLCQEMDDPTQAMHASVAWSKLLMVELDILLAGYVTELPTEPNDLDGA